MFIVDSFVGNFDRHNVNWGFLINNDTNEVEIAPVFDCASCLYPKLEDEKIKKLIIDLTKIYILLKQVGINIEGMHYDIAIASYILNPTNNKLNIDNLIEQYLNIDINEYTK